MDAFRRFRRELGLQETWPIPLIEIVDFIAYMFKNGYTHSTINCYISGIGFYSKLNNQNDLTNTFIVKKMLDGIRRCSVNKSDARLPITRDLLRQILSVVQVACNGFYEACLFRSAFTLCYHGLFRVSELASDSSMNHAIQISNVRHCDDGVEINLKRSKTDQYGSGVTIHLSPSNDQEICPIQALKKFLQYRPKVEGNLFCHYNGHALTKYQFSSVLRHSLSILGIPSINISTHSFRIGMATQCAIDGYPDEHIKKLGRWKSDVFTRYIRIPNN